MYCDILRSVLHIYIYIYITIKGEAIIVAKNQLRSESRKVSCAPFSLALHPQALMSLAHLSPALSSEGTDGGLCAGVGLRPESSPSRF